MRPEWLRLDLDLVERVGLDGAVLYSLLEYRANGTGSWEGTRAEMAEDTTLTDHRVRRALEALREADLVSSNRADRFRPILTWTIVCAGQPEKVSRTITRVSEAPPPEMVSGTTSPNEVQELDTPPSPSTDDGLFQAPAKPAPRRKPKVAYPADFRPKQSHISLAAELGVDLRVQGPLFQDHHVAKDSRFASWDAALNTWIRNAARWQDERNGHATVTHLRPVDLPPPPRTDLYG